jgi:hypothetical protein
MLPAEVHAIADDTRLPDVVMIKVWPGMNLGYALIISPAATGCGPERHDHAEYIDSRFWRCSVISPPAAPKLELEPTGHAAFMCTDSRCTEAICEPCSGCR